MQWVSPCSWSSAPAADCEWEGLEETPQGGGGWTEEVILLGKVCC